MSLTWYICRLCPPVGGFSAHQSGFSTPPTTHHQDVLEKSSTRACGWLWYQIPIGFFPAFYEDWVLNSNGDWGIVYWRFFQEDFKQMSGFQTIYVRIGRTIFYADAVFHDAFQIIVEKLFKFQSYSSHYRHKNVLWLILNFSSQELCEMNPVQTTAHYHVLCRFDICVAGSGSCILLFSTV